MKIPKYCVLIATYNEAENIKELLSLLTEEYKIPVFIVDDNSPDGTAKIAETFPNTKVMVRTNKRGIASAYIDGFKWILEGSGFDYIVQMDAGWTHHPRHVLSLIKTARDKEADLVLATRKIHEQKIKSYRTVLSKSARFLMGLVGIHQTDVTSGFRCWNTALLKKINFDKIDAKGFAFQLQMLYNAACLRAKIYEFPIEYILTNSSLNWKIVLEAGKVWTKLFFNHKKQNTKE